MGRAGDSPDKNFFRSERFFNADSQWYFATRELSDQGPYATREQAQARLADYLRWHKKAQARSERQVADRPTDAAAQAEANARPENQLEA